MPKVTYRQRDGSDRSVDLAVGHSVMEGAIRNNMPGIDAECGGGCACATCHVYVDPDWMERAGEPSSLEDAMLMLARNRRPGSRLSCQVRMTADLDGLRVEIPESQRGGCAA